MKYNSIMNTNNLMRSCEKLGPVITRELMNLECVVTEKIHGENFRVGVDGEGNPFIGQKNNKFYLMLSEGWPTRETMAFVGYDAHPHWNRMNHECRTLIDKLATFSLSKYNETGDSFVFFGELCGNGMQSGFVYPWDGLKVLYFDVLYTSNDDEGYYLPNRDAYYWMDYNKVPRVPVVATKLTVAEALKLDVESMKSEVAESDFIEGVVIKPVDRIKAYEIWKGDSRFIIKHKTQRYSEQKQRSTKNRSVNTESVFCDFVTIARLEHAVQAAEEAGNIVEYEMRDLRFLRNFVIDDITKEENNNEPLSKEDIQALNKYIPKVYSDMLRVRTEELLGI